MTYRIRDEPIAGPLSTAAVRPLWPLLALMFGGTWLSWPWFAWNAFATGSPTKLRELAWVAGGFFGSFLVLLGWVDLAEAEVIPAALMPYTTTVILVWKLLVSYVLFTMQSRCFDLYEYFGGTVRNGFPVLLLGYFARPQVLGAVPGDWLAVVLA